LHPAGPAHILAPVSVSSDLSGDLAAEIRAAVGRTSRPAAAEPPAPSSGGETGARLSLDRAAAHVTPSVPQGARLSLLKRFALRALRFLWRDQATFNAMMIESMQAALAELANRRINAQRLSADLSAASDRMQHAVDEWSSAWERRGAIEDGRIAALEATAAAPRGTAPPPTTADARIPEGVYSLFEERFRGRPEEVAAKQRGYLPLFDDLPGPALDVGCGRGELLRLLAERGVPASGVEINPIAASEARQSGLPVEESDALAALTARPAASLGAVAAIQVVEHWSPQTIFAFLRETRRVLAPRGLLLLETINTNSLSAWKAFYMDPSHVRPVPPEMLRFLAEAAGFADVRIDLRSPLPEAERLEVRDENDTKIDRLLFGAQDYALIAYRPIQG
jgi:SAM-dependent methyltransferase